LCQVTSEQVKGLGKLDELRIAGNQLQSLSFLVAGVNRQHPSLPSLVQLDASGNRLCAASLRNLQPLAQLSELNLAGNQIEEIESCVGSSFPSLEILDLAGNLLHRGAEDMTHLKELTSLRELMVQGNPFMSQSEPETQQALAILDCLEFLDDQRVEKADPLAAVTEGGEDTFPLTLARGVSSGQPEQKRPDSATGSRPGTASSQRPGTAQKMSEAGVKDPLMHSKPKLSSKKYATEEQVVHWEQQTMNGLLAVQKQIDKTTRSIDADMQNMSKFLNKADKCLEREKELAAKRPDSPDEAGRSELPTLRSATIARANSTLAEEAPVSHRDSRVQIRLREAVERGREDGEYSDGSDDPLAEAGNLPLSPVASSPSRLSPSAAAAAACDEEISEDEPVIEGSPAASSPEPAEEVEEEELNSDEAPAKPSGLGMRASRALAAATASVAADASPPELRVEARSKDRGGLAKRPSSRESRGRVGGQPSQARRPPAAPVRMGAASRKVG